MFDLDSPPLYRLGRPPLMKAIGQVSFPFISNITDLRSIEGFKAAVEEKFPYMHQLSSQQVSVALDPLGSSSVQSNKFDGWLFSDDSDWALQVFPNSATISVGSQYFEFDNFQQRFSKVMDALSTELHIKRIDRIALRYINVVEIPQSEPSVWKAWFKPEIIGWIGSDIVNNETLIEASITQTMLIYSMNNQNDYYAPDVNSVLRHGLIPANTIIPGLDSKLLKENKGFLIDIDSYINSPQAFDAQELTHQISKLHSVIDKFFFWILTDEGAKYFERLILK